MASIPVSDRRAFEAKLDELGALDLRGASSSSLLAFRHFFRHAYAVSFDLERIEALRRDALRLRPLLAQDLDRFDAFLRDLAEA